MCAPGSRLDSSGTCVQGLYLSSIFARSQNRPCPPGYWSDPFSDLCAPSVFLGDAFDAQASSLKADGWVFDPMTTLLLDPGLYDLVKARRSQIRSQHLAQAGSPRESSSMLHPSLQRFSPVRRAGVGVPAVTVTMNADGSCPPGYTPFPGTNQCIWTGPGSPPDPATGAGPGPAQGITVVAQNADGSCPPGYIPIPQTGTCSWDWGTYPQGPGGAGSPPSVGGGGPIAPIQQGVCDPGSTLIFGQCVSVFGSGLPIGTPPVTTAGCPAGYVNIGGQCLPAFVPPGQPVPPTGGYIPAPGSIGGSIPQVLANIPPGLIPPGLLPPGALPGTGGPTTPVGLPLCPPDQIRSQGGAGPCFSPGVDVQPIGPGPVTVPPLPPCPPGTSRWMSPDGPCAGIAANPMLPCPPNELSFPDGAPCTPYDAHHLPCPRGYRSDDSGRCRAPGETYNDVPGAMPAKTNWLPIVLVGGALAAVAGVAIAKHRRGRLPSPHVLHHAGARRQFALGHDRIR